MVQEIFVLGTVVKHSSWNVPLGLRLCCKILHVLIICTLDT